MYQLKVILATTREGRKGPAVAAWFMEWLTLQHDFEAELIDLKAVNLPFLDEPEHPKLRRYHRDHTKRWSKMIDPADAFVFVTCEYNYGFPAPLKNALDFIYHEWNYKPAAFVSYGGIGAGVRAVQMLKEVVTTQKMVPLFEAVHIPFFTNHINEEGEFIPTESMIRSAEIMMKELLKWTKGLKAMREAEK
ncbi:MAG: NAD(P)H-dependent oxidoreductase [Chitinophagaceae bacterium]|jgi:NAD(P)H-dependent FMN reductase|nr:MAG: NAD(P)H-dependent oxidoreductase [Chitinophagaceae bacterium]